MSDPFELMRDHVRSGGAGRVAREIVPSDPDYDDFRMPGTKKSEPMFQVETELLCKVMDDGQCVWHVGQNRWVTVTWCPHPRAWKETGITEGRVVVGEILTRSNTPNKLDHLYRDEGLSSLGKLIKGAAKRMCEIIGVPWDGKTHPDEED